MRDTDCLVSIIVPIFNMVKFVGRCIESLTNQTYTNLEIILVNDGSFDGSRQVCENYAVKDSRVSVYNKENGGVSSARNLGISHAKGDYIVFCDADDFYYNTAIEQMYNTSKLHQDSFCVFNLDVEGRNGNVKTQYDVGINKTYLKNDRSFCKMIINESFNNPVGKLFKSKTVKNNNIFFDENIKTGEDFIFFLDYIKFVDKIYVSGVTVYFYYDNLASATRNFKLEYLKDINIQLMLMKNIAEELNCLDLFLEKQDKYIFFLYCSMILLKEQKYKGSIIKKELNSYNNFRYILNSNYKSKSFKTRLIRFILKYVNYDLYYFFYRWYDKLNSKQVKRGV